jgi:hypothetical protein
MKLKCNACKYQWTYKGVRKIGQFISCSACKRNIRLGDKNIIPDALSIVPASTIVIDEAKNESYLLVP